jgi:hypothetical protein
VISHWAASPKTNTSIEVWLGPLAQAKFDPA